MIPIIENTYASKGLYQELLNPLCRKYELTDTQLIILLYLEDSNPADSAAMIMHSQRLKKSVVSNSIAELKKKGLVSSSFHEGNRKTKHLQITEEARQIIDEAKKIQQDFIDILTGGLEKREVEELNSLIARVNQNMQEYKR
ncbi:MAG: winged helix DNA-binding protein [Erysipelotrichaceae bacterium]|jgi:MarR family transcriptional regulator for hemolysin|nr:winged helix DNA-binding protein [Erysipelotrichaceae bacterium]MBQ6217158.1 winged helix DNA-binding protein [Erysipelotrichaceae bacterium]